MSRMLERSANGGQAEVVRALLVESNLTMPAAARLLDIRQSVLRSYCTGMPVPRVVVLALERLVDLERQAATLPDVRHTRTEMQAGR